MLFADKENLKTQVAQELLNVREKEMTFYAKNLSMVGTHAALLAGFAFTILSQYKFKAPAEGVFSSATQDSLGLARSCEAPTCPQNGIGHWAWDTWFIQVFQGIHLMLTTLGMCVQLWTVCTCVFTNILGLHLALRGPEGSVDRAVRHMAQQNRMVLKKFTIGLLLFLLSVIFFSLSEYYFYVAIMIVTIVVVVSWQIYKNVRHLVNVFFIDKDFTVTGQFTEKSEPIPDGNRKRAGSLPKSVPRTSANKGRVGWMHMGDMLAGKYKHETGKPTLDETVSIYIGGLKARLGIRKSRSNGKPSSKGTRWAGLHAWGEPTMLGDGGEEEHAPSRVAETLIHKHQRTHVDHQRNHMEHPREQLRKPSSSQKPQSNQLGEQRLSAALKLQAASRSFIARQRDPHCSSASTDNNNEGVAREPLFGLTLPPYIEGILRSWGMNMANSIEPAVVRLQAGARGAIARRRSREVRNSQAYSDSRASDDRSSLSSCSDCSESPVSVHKSELVRSPGNAPKQQETPQTDCTNYVQKILEHCDPRRAQENRDAHEHLEQMRTGHGLELARTGHGLELARTGPFAVHALPLKTQLRTPGSPHSSDEEYREESSYFDDATSASGSFYMCDNDDVGTKTGARDQANASKATTKANMPWRRWERGAQDSASTSAAPTAAHGLSSSPMTEGRTRSEYTAGGRHDLGRGTGAHFISKDV